MRHYKNIRLREFTDVISSYFTQHVALEPLSQNLKDEIDENLSIIIGKKEHAEYVKKFNGELDLALKQLEDSRLPLEEFVAKEREEGLAHLQATGDDIYLRPEYDPTQIWNNKLERPKQICDGIKQYFEERQLFYQRELTSVFIPGIEAAHLRALTYSILHLLNTKYPDIKVEKQTVARIVSQSFIEPNKREMFSENTVANRKKKSVKIDKDTGTSIDQGYDMGQAHLVRLSTILGELKDVIDSEIEYNKEIPEIQRRYFDTDY